MTNTLLVSGLVVAGMGLLFVVLLSRRAGALPPGFSLERLAQISIEKYRPLEKLLAEEEYVFLASQPGFTPEIGRRFQAERRAAFRSYLRLLRRDFDDLYRGAKTIALYSREDRPDFARALIQQKIVFTWALFVVEWRLALHTMGIGRIDPAPIMRSLDALSADVRRMMLSPTADLG